MKKNKTLTTISLVSLIIVISVFLPFSCKKAAKQNPKWVGEWKSTSYSSYVTTVKIDESSKGSVVKCQNNGQMFVQCETICEGRAVEKKQKLYIGGTGYKIDQEPTTDSSTGDMYIILDGVKYTKPGNGSKPAPAHTLGESYAGGIIFLLNSSGHGLIAAPSDQGILPWCNGSFSPTGAISSNIGDGNANTIAIVNTLGTGNYAAKFCSDLVLGGYSDWFLPSSDELDLMYTNKTAIGGFTNSYYWSSTEFSTNLAHQINFSNGNNISQYRTAPCPFRAIRKF